MKNSPISTGEATTANAYKIKGSPVNRQVLSVQQTPEVIIEHLLVTLVHCTEHGYARVEIDFSREGTFSRSIIVRCGLSEKFVIDSRYFQAYGEKLIETIKCRELES